MSQKPEKSIHLTSPGFNPQNLSQYHLSIRVSDGGYAMMVGNPSRKEVLILSVAAIKDGCAGDQMQLLSKDIEAHFPGNETFLRTVAMYVNRKITFVPDALFLPEKRIRYLSSCIDLDADDHLYSHLVDGMNAHCVFAVEGEFHQQISQVKGNPEFHHPAAFLATPANNTLPTTCDIDFRLLVINSNLFLTAVQDTKLRFFNHFFFETPEAFLFYLLSARNQITQNHFSVNLTLMGDIEEGHPLVKLLSPHFTHHRFAPLPENILYHDTFKKVPWHMYADLLNTIF